MKFEQYIGPLVILYSSFESSHHPMEAVRGVKMGILGNFVDIFSVFFEIVMPVDTATNLQSVLVDFK